MYKIITLLPLMDVLQEKTVLFDLGNKSINL